MGVVLDPVASLMPPFVPFVGVIEEHMAGQLPAKGEGSRSLRLMFGSVKLRLDHVIRWAPGVGEVDEFHIHGLKAVLGSCEKRKSFKVVQGKPPWGVELRSGAFMTG